MALLGKFTKQAVEVVDYDIDATEWLSEGDYVVTATAVVSPVGLTLQSTTVIDSGKRVKVWVAGGTSGVTYKIDVTMTTEDGRVKQSEFKVSVREV